mgnify:CR=1 FL=1
MRVERCWHACGMMLACEWHASGMAVASEWNVGGMHVAYAPTHRITYRMADDPEEHHSDAEAQSARQGIHPANHDPVRG